MAAPRSSPQFTNHCCKHAKSSPACSAFNGRFLATDVNDGDSSASRSQVLPLRRISRIWTRCFNWLAPRLAAISHQPPSLLFTDWLTTVNWTTALSPLRFPCRAQLKCQPSTINSGTRLTLLITVWHEPHRKHHFHFYSLTILRPLRAYPLQREGVYQAVA
jgi:hypothetical protein